MVQKTTTPPGDTNTSNDRLTPSYAFEHVAAKLIPFDLMSIGARGVAKPSPTPVGSLNQANNRQRQKTADLKPTANGLGRNDHALQPIFETNGLVFPYNPTISEGVNVNYESVDVTHSNESYFVYKNTSNVRINLSEAIWTCDTFDNAVYALSVLHFFRTYSMMNFGAGAGGERPSGQPPSPMWFEAYGNYAFHRVPVLLEKADWTFPNNVDYVGIPEFDTPEFKNRSLATRRNETGRYTWLPMKFEVSSISLIVQHSPSYWLQFSLEDYRSGKMLSNNGSFHGINRNLAGSI